MATSMWGGARPGGWTAGCGSNDDEDYDNDLCDVEGIGRRVQLPSADGEGEGDKEGI